MSRITRRGIIPVNQITPLTYRDGVTYIEMLTELSEYIRSILQPSLQSVVDSIVADIEQYLDQANDRYIEGVREFQRIHDAFMEDVNSHLVALNDGAITHLVNDDTSKLGKTLREIFATHTQFTDFEESTNRKFADFEESTNRKFTDFEESTNRTIADFEESTSQRFNVFENETTENLRSLEMHPALVRMKANLSFGVGGTRDVSWLVFLGSSTTGGGNIEHVENRWVYKIKDYLKNVYPRAAVAYTTLDNAGKFSEYVDMGVHVVNGGVGGTTSRDYVNDTRLEHIGVLGGRASFVHMIGSNDQSLNIPVSEYIDNIEAAMQSIDTITGVKNAHFLVHSYERLDVVVKPNITDWAEYGKALELLADRDPNRRMFIDLSPHYKSLGFPNTDELGIMQERVHQNEYGHHVMADMMRDYLRIPKVSSLPKPVPRIVGSDRFISSGSIIRDEYWLDMGSWSWTDSIWDSSNGYAVPRGKGIARMSATRGSHSVEARLNLSNIPDGGRAGVSFAHRSAQKVYFVAYFLNDTLRISRNNSNDVLVQAASIGHLMNDTVLLRAEYIRGLINVYVDNVLKLSYEVPTHQQFYHADASWAGMFAGERMDGVFEECRIYSMVAE